MASSASVDPEPFKLALCQLQVTADKEENITSATKAVKEAASNGANIVRRFIRFRRLLNAKG